MICPPDTFECKGGTLARRAACFAVAAAELFSPTLSRADGVDGPALVAWVARYNDTLPEAPTHGHGCINRPEHMPDGRRDWCGKPLVERLGTGHSAITIENAAPFPTIADDSGHAIFVTAIGSNAHCFEESTMLDGNTLSSVVRCASPASGEPTDSDFSWSYRADSTDFPQQARYLENFAYARVAPDGQVVPAESFNPMNLHEQDVLSTREDTGDYTLTFKDLNPADGLLDAAFSPYNVIVQKTCAGDTGGSDESDCARTVCVPHAWTPGDWERWDTVVQVRCRAHDGSPRDTSFRVFVGSEGFTSQGSWDGGFRYGWANYSLPPTELGCYDSTRVPSTSQHETPLQHYPGLPVETCRVGPGQYQLNFGGDTLSPYSIDGMNPVVSSRVSDATYCNVQSIECADHQLCALPQAPPTTRVTVACYDPSGAPADVPWTLNMTY